MDKRVAINFKLFYFFRFMGQGVFYPYLVLYLTQNGISGGQLGLVLMMLPLGKLLLTPVFGYASDIYRIHKQILTGSVLVLFCGAGLLFFSAKTFIGSLIGMFIVTLGDLSVDTLINTLAIDYLSRSGSQTHFGRWRLWGAVGFMVGSFLMGLFELERTLVLVPLLFALTNFLSFLASFSLPRASAAKPVDLLGGFKLVTENRSFAFLLLGIILFGMSFNIIFNYYSVYMTGIGAASWMIGLGVAMQTIVEIILSANTQRISSRFPLRVIYLFGFALLPLRALFYVLNRSPFVGLLIQNIHGFNIFSAFILGLLVLDRVLKPEWRSTGQSYYYSAFGGFGATIASLIAPLIFERSGVSTLFLFAMVIGTAGFLFLSLATRNLIPRPEKLPEKPAE